MFTTPTVILQPISGVGLMYLSGHTVNETWLWLSIGLFVLAGLCWLPVVYLQIMMRNLSTAACEQNTVLPDQCHRYARIWFWLGVPAFLSILAVFGLMAIKP